jgi:hypothetical protein
MPEENRQPGTENKNGEPAVPPVLTPREAAAQARIAELRMRLLDLTNSNRLLNYKFSDRSRRQVRLVDELPDELMERLEDSKRLAFKPLPELDDEPKDERDDAFLVALEQATRSDEEYLAALDKLGDDEDGEGARRADRLLRDRVRKTLRMPDRLLRDAISKAAWARQHGIDPNFDLPMPRPEHQPAEAHSDKFMQTLLLPDEMERVLSAVYDQTHTTLQETGVNTLYLALGYLEWYEAAESQTRMYAPLLLHPVDIERKIVSGKYRYSIGSLDEETQINITLSERLYQDFHRRLPPLNEPSKGEVTNHQKTTDSPARHVRDRGLKSELEVAALAYRDVSGSDGVERHPWFGIGNAALDYFGREDCLRSVARLREGLDRLLYAAQAVGDELGAPASETIGEAQWLAAALARLPAVAPGIDSTLYAALENPSAFEAMETFCARQADWLEASQKLAQAASDPEALTQQRSELDELVLLATQARVDKTALGGLAEEAGALANEADRVERAVAVARRLATAFEIESAITADVARKVLAGAKSAAALSHDLLGLRHPGLFDEAAAVILAEARGKTDQLATRMRLLNKRLNFGLDHEPGEWRGHARALREARFPSSLWRRDVRAATQMTGMWG